MAQDGRVEIRKAIQYGTHDGTALIGDLYLPEGTEIRPVIVAVHGGCEFRSIVITDSGGS
jgi:predicted acyl esterase